MFSPERDDDLNDSMLDSFFPRDFRKVDPSFFLPGCHQKSLSEQILGIPSRQMRGGQGGQMGGQIDGGWATGVDEMEECSCPRAE